MSKFNTLPSEQEFDYGELILVNLSQNKSLDYRWSGFKRSVNKKNNRNLAQCSYCLEKLEGRVHNFPKHVSLCPAISAQNRELYFANLNQFQKKGELERDVLQNVSPVVVDKEAAVQKRPKLQKSFRSISDNESKKLHLGFAKFVIVSGNVGFRLMENPFFMDYQKVLSEGRHFELPDRFNLFNSAIPELYKGMVCEKNLEVKMQDSLTVVLDGWADFDEHTRYAVILRKGAENFKYYIGNINMRKNLRLAPNILTGIEDIFKEKNFNFQSCLAVVSDNSNVMMSFKKLIQERYPHITPLRSVLHDFNAILRHLIEKCTNTRVNTILKNNKTLINYLHQLDIENFPGKNKKKEPFLEIDSESTVDSRWSFYHQMFKNVETLEEIVKNHVSNASTTSDSNSSNNNILEVLKDDPYHFLENQIILNIISPLKETISNLENENSNIGDIWPQFIIAYEKVRKIIIPQHLEDFKLQIINLIQLYSTFYQEPIYFLAFFLCPKYKKIAVSKKFNLKDIIRFALNIALVWGLNQSHLQNLAFQMKSYYNDEASFISHYNVEPIRYWKNLVSDNYTNVIKIIATKLFEIVIQCSGAENLFSIFSEFHKVLPSQSEYNTMEIMAQLKYHLMDETKMEEKRKVAAPRNNSSVFDSNFVGENKPLSQDFFDKDMCEELQRGVNRLYAEDEESIKENNTEILRMEDLFNFDLIASNPELSETINGKDSLLQFNAGSGYGINIEDILANI